MSPRRVALITGASAGIGAAYAEALARDGYDLVLVARRAERLEALAQAIREREKVEVGCLPADLSGAAGLRAVEERIERGEFIDLLVNNAGRGSFGVFWDLPRREELEQADLNATSMLRLAHAALSRMVPARRGALIFVSSLSGYQPSPYSATYGATKAFVNSLAHALREELRGTRVRVQLLCPGFTRTEFQSTASVPAEKIPALAWTDAQVVVDASLQALKRDRFLCTPGHFSKTLGVVMRLAPAALARRVAGWVTRPMLPPPS